MTNPAAMLPSVKADEYSMVRFSPPLTEVFIDVAKVVFFLSGQKLFNPALCGLQGGHVFPRHRPDTHGVSES